MIFVVVLVLVVGLAIALVVGVAKDPGPTPDRDRARLRARLGPARLRRRLPALGSRAPRRAAARPDWIAREARRVRERLRARSPRRAGRGRGRDRADGDAATVMTRLTLRDGSVVHNEVRLLRRSRAWEVVAYELRPAAAA